ncbi:MAG: TlpA family protein disulfide reductase [Polyangiaceae bacterium]|nr:TlpA family protein disulfide reductase [Polyangiaceae bacterium]
MLGLAAVSALLVSCGGSSSKASAPEAQMMARPLPAASIAPLEGGAARPVAEVTRGKVAVIDIWATWCGACKNVAATLELLADARKHTDLLIVGVDVGEDRETVARYFDGKQPRYPIYLDPDFAVANGLSQTELPAVVVVDRTGTVRLVGRKVDKAMVKLVDELLAAPAAAPTPPSP